MKHLLTIILALSITVAFSQSDSTKTDSVKVKKWSIPLNTRQQSALADFDQRTQALSLQYQALVEQKEAYLRSIVENKNIDVRSIENFKYENGRLIFIERKPK